MALADEFNQKALRPGNRVDPAWNEQHSLATAGVGTSMLEKAEYIPGKLAYGISRIAPVAGMGLTVHSALKEVEEDWHSGKHGKAVLAALTGAIETGGSVAGFGVGDILREATRGAIGAVFGKEYMPDKSGLRELGSLGCDAFVASLEKKQQETRREIHAQQRELLDKDPALPKTVQLPDGRNIAMAQALKDPKFMKYMRDTLACSAVDCSKQIATLDHFAELEAANAPLMGRAAARRKPGPAPGGQTA